MSLSRTESRSLVVASCWRPGAAVIVAGLALGGCSADVARFDFPSFNLADKGAETGSLPKPSQSLGRAGGADIAGETPREAPSGNNVYTPGRALRGGQDVQVSALPEPAQPSQPASAAASPPPASARRAAPSAVTQPAAAPPPSVVGKGDMIEVHQGDTLFGLAKRHKVSLAELTAVNDLKSPNLKPGQKLYLPSGRHAATGGPQKPLAKPAPVAAATPAAPAHAANWDGTYTVKQGDSLYNIARSHKVQVAELQQVNAITDVRKVKPGVVLKVPAEAGAVHAAGTSAAAPIQQSQSASASEAPRIAPSTKPTVLNAGSSSGEKRVAAVVPTDTATDATPQAAPAEPEAKPQQVASAAPAAAGAGAGKLRWPAKGKVIAGFGPRTDGSHNDGVNVAVPMGTDVHAAESGTVAYAGNELKGYGNLVLLRHDNGWVTAYAHAEQLLVRRGDKVKRGQVIAKAGKSGTVDQPQVHFELRQGSKPVDPTPFMERM